MSASPTSWSATPTRTFPSAPSTIALPVRVDGSVEISKKRLMWEQFSFFMSELRDDTGRPLDVAWHHEHWAHLMQEESRLVLMAPRDHGKTWTQVCYLMWRIWRHNRRPDGEWDTTNPDGVLEAALFSATYGQAGEFFGKMQMLILANEDLFLDILPTGARGSKAAIKDAWTGGFVRMRNRASVGVKAWQTSVRGMHPSIIVLDDVLTDQNSATKHQRDKTWRFFVGTISPMLGPEGQLIVIGTAQHYADLLHRLKEAKNPDGSNQFRFVKYRAVNWENDRALWPRRHDINDLRQRRALDPILFAKEFQNDPRDDASSLFPFSLTQPAIDKGKGLGFAASYHKDVGELVVLSADMALSESTGADYCVVNIARVNMATQQRTLLYALRERGWGFQQQVDVLRQACVRYDVDFGVIENNSFQRWVRDRARSDDGLLTDH